MADTDSTATLTDSEVMDCEAHKVSEVRSLEETPDFIFEFDSLVTLLIGPEECRIDVHKEVLCRASAFFDAALNGEHYLESNGIIKLPEQEVPTFKYFVNWLYTRRLRRYHYPSYCLEKDAWEAAYVHGLQDHVCSTIADVYYSSSSAGPSTVAFWRQGEDRPPGLESPVDSINLAWATIPEPKEDPLCIMLSNIAGAYIEDFSEAPFDATVSPEFLRDAYKALASGCIDLKRGYEGRFDICAFHKHDAGCPKLRDFPLYDKLQATRKQD
ncbi:hypothetical protein G7Y79_00004g013130 [Physcia stellaris]|nr:hypothetical protein G7Y79_00004g013130 [Physcia stellaris]